MNPALIQVDGPAVRRLWDDNYGRGFTPADLFDAAMIHQGLNHRWETTGWQNQCTWLDALSTAEVSLVIH